MSEPETPDSEDTECVKMTTKQAFGLAAAFLILGITPSVVEAVVNML